MLNIECESGRCNKCGFCNGEYFEATKKKRKRDNSQVMSGEKDEFGSFNLKEPVSESLLDV